MDNVPGAARWRLATGALFPSGHPYHSVAASEHETVVKASRDELEALHRRHYRPENGVMALVGDFDPGDALRFAEQYLGRFPRGIGPEPPTPAPPPAAVSARSLLVEAGVTQPELLLFYRTPPRLDPDDAELSLLPGLLAGRAGWLQRRLVRERGLAESVGVHYLPLQLGGGLAVSLLPRAGHELAELLAAYDEELAPLRTRGLGAKKWRGARLASRSRSSRRTSGTPRGRSRSSRGSPSAALPARRGTSRRIPGSGHAGPPPQGPRAAPPPRGARGGLRPTNPGRPSRRSPHRTGLCTGAPVGACRCGGERRGRVRGPPGGGPASARGPGVPPAPGGSADRAVHVEQWPPGGPEPAA